MTIIKMRNKVGYSKNAKRNHVLFLIKHIFWFLKNWKYGDKYFLFSSTSEDHDKINKELYKKIMKDKKVIKLNKAKELAKGTQLRYIKMNIKDWDVNINYISTEIDRLKKAKNNAIKRRELWKEALKIKRGLK